VCPKEEHKHAARHSHGHMGRRTCTHIHVHVGRPRPGADLGEAYGEEVAAVGDVSKDREGIGVCDGGGDGSEVVGVEAAVGRAGRAVGGGVEGAVRARLWRSRTRSECVSSVYKFCPRSAPGS
jgi:hypothetical protein